MRHFKTIIVVFQHICTEFAECEVLGILGMGNNMRTESASSASTLGLREVSAFMLPQ